MKFFFQTILIFIFNSVAFGQNKGHQFDSLLFKAIERCVKYVADNNDQTTSGFILLNISKIDTTITIQSIYSTSKEFEIIPIDPIIKELNEEFNKLLISPYKLIVPVYYYNNGDTAFSIQLNKILEKEIKKFRQQGYIISNEPIICRKGRVIAN